MIQLLLFKIYPYPRVITLTKSHISLSNTIYTKWGSCMQEGVLYYDLITHHSCTLT